MSDKPVRFSGNGSVMYCTLNKEFVQTFALSLNILIPRSGETIILNEDEFQVYNVSYVPHELQSGLFDMHVYVWIRPLSLIKKES